MNEINVFFQVLTGCVSSLIIWWFINFICSPRLRIAKGIENKNDRFVEIQNKSLFNAYNVLIRVEYRYNNNPNDAQLASKPRIPTIERGEIVQIELSDLEEFSVNEFFNNAKGKDSTVILISYESKFGVRKMAKRTFILKESQPNIRRV